ncbi:MAG: toll/interleukin-1 receptor domain-containing protein [Gammaproteobacteria bacterium]
MATRTYRVFLSYRHADNREEGRQWASWLQQVIETYEIPRDLVGKKNSRGEVIPERIFPLFRDEEELAANASLSSGITLALDNSEHLLVICSPRAVESAYVQAEIDYFKQSGKGDAILAMIVDGEPDSDERECFPEPLRFDTDASGQRHQSQLEPIAADFRVRGLRGEGASQGWTSIEAFRQELNGMPGLTGKQIDRLLDNYRKQHELMKLKLISGILEIPLGELTRRDQAYQMELERKRSRTLRRWLTAVAVLALLALGGGVYAWLQQQEAVRQEQVATRNYSLQLTAKGLEELDDARIEEGLAYLVSSLREWPENNVARDRLLFELAYRGWLSQAARLPAPPELEPAIPGSEKPARLIQRQFEVESGTDDGMLVLRQRIDLEIDSQYKHVSRLLAWDGRDWKPGEPVVTDAPDLFGQEIQLGDGRRIISMPNAELPIGYADIELIDKDGQVTYFEDRHGLIALSPDGGHLATAGFSDVNGEPAFVHIQLFSILTLAEASANYLLAIPAGLDVTSLVWDGRHLVLASMLHGRLAERIDILEVSEAGGKIEARTLVENRLIPGKEWDFHNGFLYVIAPDGLITYALSRPLMKNWTAPEISLRDIDLLSGIDASGIARDSWSRLKTAGSASGIQVTMSSAHSVLLRDASGEVMRTIEAAVPGYGPAPNLFFAMGLSHDEQMLALSSLFYEGEGDVRYLWQILSVENGFAIFPLSQQYDGPAGPPLLREVFHTLRMEGWAADSRSMVFTPAGPVPALGSNETNATFLQRMRTGRGALVEFFMLPLRWSDEPVPAWFLETISHLVHLKQDTLHGLGFVSPLPSALREEVRKVIQEQGAEKGSGEYIDFLQRLPVMKMDGKPS